MRAQFQIVIFATVFFGLFGVAGHANADTVFAQSIAASSGSFGIPNPNPIVTLGAPDSGFTQFGDGSSLTLDFGSLLSAPGTLSVYTYDDLYPDTAKVEVSANGINFTTVAGSILDTNGVLTGGVYPSADIAVAIPFQFVRITDLVNVGEEPYRDLGFDLDAVGYKAAPVPVPSNLAMSSILLGMLGVVWAHKRLKVIVAV